VNFIAARARANDLNRKLYNEFIQKALDDGLHSKSFWKFLRSKRTSSSVADIKTPDGILLSNPYEKACTINRFFHSVFETDASSEVALQCDVAPSTMDPILINEGHVHFLLKNLKPGKSTGPDGLPGVVLRNMRGVISPFLTALFRKILDSGQIPLDWKLGHVVPIFKSGDKHDPSNYRPVSLTCIVSKLFERILYSRVYAYLTANNLLSSDQHGFRENLSCETQIITLFHDLAKAMDCRRDVDVIFLDFKKAFDKVSHQKVIFKLNSLGIDPKVIQAIKSFLTCRTQRVVLDGTVSTSVPVTSGVPQGSVLGPLLFLIFINDLSHGLSSNVRLFADDTVIYRTVSGPEDSLALQADLTLIVEWCHRWGMSLNYDKCVSMSVSRRRLPRVPFTYQLGKSILRSVSKYKYLGVVINNKLTWDDHILYVVSKANRALGFVRRHLSKCEPATRLKCYVAFVRPHLEFASCAWDPFSSTHIEQVEGVQRRAARFILSEYARHASVSTMLASLNLTSLQERRRHHRLKLFYLIDRGWSLMNVPTDLVRKMVQRRTDNGFAYAHMASHSNPYYSSYYVRTVRDWDALPPDVVNQCTLSAFSRKL
jgi:hypothetical protein